MKYQIRKNCFETNSSSMHSLIVTGDSGVYTKDEIRKELYIHKDNTVDLWYSSDNYGTSFDYLSTFSEKLGYALAEFCGDCYSLQNYLDAEDYFYDVFEPLIKELAGVDEVKPSYEREEFDIYEDSINEDAEGNFNPRDVEEVPYDDIEYIGKWEDQRKITKSGREIYKASEKVVSFGSVDHQSKGLLRGFMKKYNVSLKDFLIRKDIAVVVDGDEYCIFDNMIRDGIINMKNIKAKYPSNGCYDEVEK